MTNQLDIFAPLPALPYAGTSGWSGTDTSQTRANTADHDGTTRDRQTHIIRMLSIAKHDGLTWAEVADLTGWHHGTASGALSVLHKENRIMRLTHRRNKCKIYVLPEYVAARQTEKHGRNKPTECPHCGGTI